MIQNQRPRPEAKPSRSGAEPEAQLRELADRLAHLAGNLREGGEALLERGREMAWHPPYMRSRYENWVENLNGDWLKDGFMNCVA